MEGMGLGGKRCVRSNLSITNEDEKNLKMLATACNMQPTTLAYELFRKSLYNIQYIHELQKEYCTQQAYRVRLVQHDGKLHFTLTGRDDL